MNQFKDAINKFHEAIEILERIGNETFHNKSILDGKVAIQVNNKHEFKLLMEHYDGKWWRWHDGENALTAVSITYPNNIEYSNKFCHSIDSITGLYKIVPFADFAAEVGIKVPVKILTSVDGVDLYEGDKYIPIYLHGDQWAFESEELRSIESYHSVMIKPETCKAFSTKESAEKWIEEQNRPQAIDVKLFNRPDKAVVVKTGVTISIGGVIVTLSHSDIEDIQHAINELNCYKTTSK